MKLTHLFSVGFSIFLILNSGTSLAEPLINETDMNDIRQYCEELHAFGTYETENDRKNNIDTCITEEKSRYIQEPQD